MIDTRTLLAIAGAAFLVLALARAGRRGWRDPAVRTWLIIGTVFVAVATVLWVS